MEAQHTTTAAKKLMLGAYIGQTVTGLKDIDVGASFKLPTQNHTFLVTGISGVRDGFIVKDYDLILDSIQDNDSLTVSADVFVTHFSLAV